MSACVQWQSLRYQNDDDVLMNAFQDFTCMVTVLRYSVTYYHFSKEVRKR